MKDGPNTPLLYHTKSHPVKLLCKGMRKHGTFKGMCGAQSASSASLCLMNLLFLSHNHSGRQSFSEGGGEQQLGSCTGIQDDVRVNYPSTLWMTPAFPFPHPPPQKKIINFLCLSILSGKCYVSWFYKPLQQWASGLPVNATFLHSGQLDSLPPQ